MTMITVLYPRDDQASFDHEYYAATHLPLVERHWRPHGLTSAKALRGVDGPDGSPSPYFTIALLAFDSPDAVAAALASAGTAEVMGDIANFTTVQPIIQFNEAVG